ncbi:hypothetical protein [Desulfolutivibrio sp.]|uniref:hypothetical protein n=1 Tax=Desulfolutivibrio sp. TaxID=2773296 RepID=UPI002F963D03
MSLPKPIFFQAATNPQLLGLHHLRSFSRINVSFAALRFLHGFSVKDADVCSGAQHEALPAADGNRRPGRVGVPARPGHGQFEEEPSWRMTLVPEEFFQDKRICRHFPGRKAF